MTPRRIERRTFLLTTAYLVLPAEQRVFCVVLDTEPHAIERMIGSVVIEHGTTLYSEDHLVVSGDDPNNHPSERFWVQGVPFPFARNALLIGIDPYTGDTADRPVVAIDEFRRMITFADQRDATVVHSSSDRSREPVW